METSRDDIRRVLKQQSKAPEDSLIVVTTRLELGHLGVGAVNWHDKAGIALPWTAVDSRFNID